MWLLSPYRLFNPLLARIIQVIFKGKLGFILHVLILFWLSPYVLSGLFISLLTISPISENIEEQRLLSFQDVIGSNDGRFILSVTIISYIIIIVWLVFGIAHAKNLYWTNETKIEKGRLGEQETIYQLNSLGNDYFTINNVYLDYKVNGISPQLDHLVIGPNGIFHIDSKNWEGDIHFSSHGWYRKKGSMKNHEPRQQIQRHNTAIKDLLKDHGWDVSILGIVVFTNSSFKLKIDYDQEKVHPNFKLLQLPTLVFTIKNHPSDNLLSPEEIQKLYKFFKENTTPCD